LPYSTYHAQRDGLLYLGRPPRLELDGSIETQEGRVADLVREAFDPKKVKAWQSPRLHLLTPDLGSAQRVGQLVRPVDTKDRHATPANVPVVEESIPE
jgi:hypothetical protein